MNYIIREIELNKLTGSELSIDAKFISDYFTNIFNDLTLQFVSDDVFSFCKTNGESLIRQKDGILWCEYIDFWQEINLNHSYENVQEFIKYYVKEYSGIDNLGVPVGTITQVHEPNVLISAKKSLRYLH